MKNQIVRTITFNAVDAAIYFLLTLIFVAVNAFLLTMKAPWILKTYNRET